MSNEERQVSNTLLEQAFVQSKKREMFMGEVENVILNQDHDDIILRKLKVKVQFKRQQEAKIRALNEQKIQKKQKVNSLANKLINFLKGF